MLERVDVVNSVRMSHEAIRSSPVWRNLIWC